MSGDQLHPGSMPDRIAAAVVERPKPGCGPMLLPEWAVDVLAELGQHGGYQMANPLHLGSYHAAFLHTRIQPGGALWLALELDGNARVWEGVLRGPGRGA